MSFFTSTIEWYLEQLNIFKLQWTVHALISILIRAWELMRKSPNKNTKEPKI